MRTVSSLLPPANALAERVIIISGANGGLGEAVARACATSGARVVLIGRRLPKLTRLYDDLIAGGAMDPALYPMDLSGAVPDDYVTMAEAIHQEYGRIDGIVHCANEFKGLASLENMPLEDWFTGMHVNLTAPFLMTRALLPYLRQRNDACALFLLDNPERTNKAFWGSYGVAKQGLIGLVSILQQELESSPVRVRGVQPGPMRTALRGRAYFAEDATHIPPATAYAAAIVTLLSEHGKSVSETIVKLEASTNSGPRTLGLPTFNA